MPWSKIKPEINEPDFDNLTADSGRILSYPEAVREAFRQALETDPRVFIMGQGVDDPGGMFGTTRDLHKEFGSERVFDTPLAETALTGVAVGAAIAQMRPVYLHNRPDFLLLAMDQIVNHASKWHYMFGGKVNCPLVIWACTGRGWGSAAQHSQTLHALFMHIPGLKIVMPSTCYDAKGLILEAIADPNPIIILDHRMNFRQKGNVPAEMYRLPFGKGVIRRKGKDITLVCISHLVTEGFLAAKSLESSGIDVEVIDPRTLKPLDIDLILDSVKKTGRLAIADTGWKTGGVSAEIFTQIAEKGFHYLKAPLKRISCPDVPTPASYVLEDVFYPGRPEIENAIRELVKE